MLKVTFLGEETVDDGGPRREFLSFLMKEAFHTSGLFYNVEAVTANKFFLVGKISTSLIQRGQPPPSFARAVADFVVFDEVKSSPCLDDIPDYEVRQKLKEVHCQ